MDKLTDIWTMTFKDKKQIYGSNRVPVGGRTPESQSSGSDEELDDALEETQGSDSRAHVRADEALEPF